MQDREAIHSGLLRVLETAMVNKELNAGVKLSADYVASLIFQLVAVRDFQSPHWVANIVPYLTPFAGETEAHAVAEGILARCQEADQRAADQIAAAEDVEEGEHPATFPDDCQSAQDAVFSAQ